MKVLIVKTSSMGDLVHTLPAVTDAARALPGIRFDWVAEESFIDIPAWHPSVERVIPIALRRWRKSLFSPAVTKEISTVIAKLRRIEYDCVIDAQGLIKSGIVTGIARGRVRCGMDRQSCKEGLASFFYQHRVSVRKGIHAADRVRRLFSTVLDYPCEVGILDFGLNGLTFDNPGLDEPYLVFLHGTSAKNKLWANTEWIKLGQRVGRHGFKVYLPWGNRSEYTRAAQLAARVENMEVLPRMGVDRIAAVIAGAQGVVGVDTGLSHLAAAFGIPGITLYIATFPGLTGTRGKNQICLCSSELERPPNAPIGFEGTLNLKICETLTADVVWNSFQSELSSS